ncbi:hypothetical protein [Nonomuraea sp. NEAU-A123]|uniref:NrtR DNA-binding winged helix domain-containing protein n=1 Tax=Nonomuraea sp. NEAU-A123 TaxID=2839649 RepID=UPI0035AB85EC
MECARVKLERSALATAFCGPTFTITQLQDVYEAVWGMSLDPRNFYRKVQKVEGFIVPAGAARKAATGRPARLFKAGPRTILSPPMVRPGETSSAEELKSEQTPRGDTDRAGSRVPSDPGTTR